MCIRDRWCCCEKHCERKREVEIFKISRKNEEFMERLGVEMVDNYSKYLPWMEADIAVVGDDNENNDFRCV